MTYHRLFRSTTHRGKSPALLTAEPDVGLPAGRENREILSLLDGADATDGDERGMELPAGREIREIFSLLDGNGATEGYVEGTGIPAGRKKQEIHSLLDGELRLAGGSASR